MRHKPAPLPAFYPRDRSRPPSAEIMTERVGAATHFLKLVQSPERQLRGCTSPLTSSLPLSFHSTVTAFRLGWLAFV